MSTLSVTLVQPFLHWGDIPQNLEHLGNTIRSYTPKTEVIFLPEMFSTGFIMEPERLAEPMDGPSVKWMRDLAESRKVVLTGSLIIREDDHYLNRLIWMLPNGQYGHYDKRHLFAYAQEDQYYAPGARRLIASVKGWKINLQVCYDLRFPVWARNAPNEQGQPEYDVLVYVANWPQVRNLAWKTLLQARAIENQCYVIGVNRIGTDGKNIEYAGGSMVIDPLGEILYLGSDQEEITTVVLERSRLDEVRTKLPFLKDADHFDISI
jgi:omega-amidase